MTFNKLGDTSYMALETFKKNGQGVSTPVWVIGKEGKLYVWTDGDSWKVKRISNNKRVRVCKCDARGNVESEWIEAEAHVLGRNDEVMRQDLAEKYGLIYYFFYFMGKIRGQNAGRVVVEISQPT